MADKQKSANKAAAKVRAAQQQKRQRMQWSVGIIVLVVAGVVVLVLAKASQPDKASKDGTAITTAPSSIATDLAKVPLTNISKAYTERLKSDPSFVVKPATGAALTKAGKPEVLYMGAEYCPYCAAERWALTVALSKFGTFSGLKMMNSSESLVPTLSFLTAKYQSDYLAFSPIELEDQDRKPLEKATPAQMKLLTGQGGGSYPYINFGGKFMQSGASVDTSVLIGKEQTAIAASLAKSNDTSAQVNSAAGGFIKAICTLTKGQPGDVCKAFPTA